MAEAMPTSAKRRRAGGRKANQISRTRRTINTPLMTATSGAPRSEGTTAGTELQHHSVRSELIEMPRFYLTCLYCTVLELGYVYVLLKLHVLFEVYVIDELPLGMKVVSIALVSLLHFLNLILLVKFSVA